MARLFNKGAYIVITGSPTPDYKIRKYYPLGWIFKQDKQSDHLKAYSNLGVGEATGHVHYRRSNMTNWRFATHDEIVMYEVEGRPIYVGANLSVDNFSII